ncbi:MAG TPA: chemotaxis protein CheB, partial [Methanomicrobiales archaeon]|nr:chemotaxis protein CheB [Methanomicrobiales archaeon]
MGVGMETEERSNQDQGSGCEREEIQSIGDQRVPSLERPRAIVGIGASAGGVEALETFFRIVSPDTGLSFVVVMHLDPDRESELPDVLQRVTEMPVVQIENSTPARPDTVHVIPPNQDLGLLHGIFILISPVE